MSGLQWTAGAPHRRRLSGECHQRTRVGKEEGASAYQPLLGHGSLSDKIKPTAYQRLDLIPSEVDLCGAEIELAQQERHLHRFREALNPILESGQYDVVLIDCPPSLAVITLNAFCAADYLLVPLQCEYYALEGVAMLTRVMNQLKEGGANAELQLLGVVMTMFDGRTRLSHQVVDEVRGFLVTKCSRR